MQLCFVKHGKYSHTYVSCKVIYEHGLSQENIVDLLLALNDCKKYNYQGKYQDNEFIKYLDCYKSIGIQLDIKKTTWNFFDTNKDFPQIIEKEANTTLFRPTKEYGVLFEKNHKFDFMPKLNFITWAWNLFTHDKKAYLKKMLGNG